MEFFDTELLRGSTISSALWLHYVDDVFAPWRDDEDFTSFFQEVNGLSESMKFTTEWELNYKFPFLDVNITRLSSGFTFSIYSKPSQSGQYKGSRLIFSPIQSIPVKQSHVSQQRTYLYP